VVSGIRFRTIVFSILLLLITLFNISLSSSVSKGLTVEVGGGPYRGTELYIESDIAAKSVAR
jgi:hypothetical protein